MPTAELASGSKSRDALTDKVKAGVEREITHMKNLQIFSWVREEDVLLGKTDLAHGLGTTGERQRSEIAMCLEGFCDDSERRCIYTDAISNVGEGTSFVCSLERSLCETGDLVCAFMQADISCWMFARLPKSQEKEGWIWRLHRAMSGMRTACRDLT